MGNNNVGKSSLCVTFSTGQFPSLFTPMECNRVPHEKDVTVGNTTVHVKCVDTEGHVSNLEVHTKVGFVDDSEIKFCSFSVPHLCGYKAGFSSL